MIGTILTILMNIVMFVMLVYSIIFKIRTRKMLDYLKQQQKDRDNGHKIFMENITNRVNLLSKENAKVWEENQMLKERLRNMGITDFDVMQ